MATPSLSHVALIQGLFLFVTGIWPLVNMDSFLRVTGTKTDLWLVITVGLLLAVIGVVLSSFGIRKQPRTESIFLGLGTAASLATVEIYFTVKGTISAIYLLDALIEMGFIFLWISALIRKRSNPPLSPL